MIDQEIHEILRKVDFLTKLPCLGQLVKVCKEVSLKPGEILFREGDLGEAMYIILSGSLEIFKKDKIIASRFTGEYVGEMALLGNNYRSASIKALTDARLLKIGEKHFHRYLNSNPAALMPLLKTLAIRAKEDLEILDSDYQQLVAQQKLAKRFKRILDDTINDIYVLDPKNHGILQVNSKAGQNTGYSVEALESLKLYDLFSDISQEAFLCKIQPLKSNTQSLVSFDAQIKRRNNTFYPVEVRLQYLDMEDPPLLLAVFQNISERKKMEHQMKQMAMYDSLTGLPNRNLLKDRFEVMLAQASRHNITAAILYMDLDNFKTLNDTLGHQTGDEFLAKVAHRLKSCLRKEDTVGRLGGDEFIIMLPNLNNEDESAKLAQKIAKIMEAPFYINAKELYSSFSIGISFCPNDGKDMETIFKNADIAMYRAKEKGGNTYEFFTPSMHEKIIHHMNTEQNLRKAIERDEFILHYQPKIDLATGNIAGLEALIRWQRPNGEIILPDKFIPIAEKSQLILLLGEWVLYSVCQQIKTWEKQLKSMQNVAINLSSRQFEHSNLTKILAKTLEQIGCNPSSLEFELTETTLMKDTKTVIKTLNELKSMGINASIDDFGSGYSSLSYLKNLPVQSLKIDKSFVKNFREKHNSAIIHAIISLCKSLELKTVAEGVETVDQRHFLQQIQCDQFQGFLYSRPLSADEIAKLIWPNFFS